MPATVPAVLSQAHRLRKHLRELQSEIDLGPRVAKSQQAHLAAEERVHKAAHDLIGKLKLKIREDEVTLKQVNTQLDKFEKRMERLEEILHNPKESEFTVVTIATEVASAETIRLLASLKDESISIRRLIINQVLPTQIGGEASEESANLATNAYLDRLRSGQKSSINELEKLAAATNTKLIQIPYFD